MPSSRCRVDGMEETRRDNMIYALPVAHRQQATEQHDGVDVAEQRAVAASQFLLDRVEDGSLADVRLEARDAAAHAPYGRLKKAVQSPGQLSLSGFCGERCPARGRR